MRIAVIGLGRMGANISRRLMRGGHQVVGFDRNQDNVRQLEVEGAIAAGSLEEAASRLELAPNLLADAAGRRADRGHGRGAADDRRRPAT